MSWDKNTINMSTLSAVKEVLDELSIPYILETRACVRGYGFNDDYNTIYSLRRLQYGDYVILEQMVMTRGCDEDDTIHSCKFHKNDEPQNWQYYTEPPKRLSRRLCLL